MNSPATLYNLKCHDCLSKAREYFATNTKNERLNGVQRLKLHGFLSKHEIVIQPDDVINAWYDLPGKEMKLQIPIAFRLTS